MKREINGIDIDTYKLLYPCDGMQIDAISMSDHDFYLNFYLSRKLMWCTEKKKLQLWSEPDCCAHHYFTCDDDLEPFIGATIQDFDLRTQPDVSGEYGDVHEISFLIITTSKGQFTVAAHNEHNGYYGGIYLSARFSE